MKLHTISLKNYRLIADAKIHLENGKGATILVGPNNSGKTSVVEAISAFLSGTAKSFAISDFSARTHVAFNAFGMAAVGIASAGSSLPVLPSLSMELRFQYDDTPDDLNVADLLLMDLDETSSDVRLRIELQPTLADELATTFKAFYSRNDKSTLREFLASTLPRYYELKYFKVAKDGGTEPIPSDDAGRLIRRLVRVDFLPAQRHMEDQEGSQQATRLSRLLNTHYEHRYKTAQPEGYEALEIAVREQADALTVKYKDAFAELKTALQTFGYPETPDLSIRAELSASAIFKVLSRSW
jgi:hypothetical protein